MGGEKTELERVLCVIYQHRDCFWRSIRPKEAELSDLSCFVHLLGFLRRKLSIENNNFTLLQIIVSSRLNIKSGRNLMAVSILIVLIELGDMSSVDDAFQKLSGIEEDRLI